METAVNCRFRGFVFSFRGIQGGITCVALATKHEKKVQTTKDTFYDRGSAFPYFVFLNDGVPSPIIVRMPILLRKMFFFIFLGHGIINRNAILFWLNSEVSFRVGYGAPKVRSLRKNRVPLW